MFNEELKQEYIRNKEENTNLPEGYLRRLFNRSETTEEYLGKDIYDFSVSEIVGLLIKLNMNSYDTLYVINSHYRLYTDYCLSKGLVFDNQNHYNEITKDRLLSCVNPLVAENKIIDREKLNKYCDMLVNYQDKFILQCFFEGICGKEMSDVFMAEFSDIDEVNNKMKLTSGRTVNVSTTLIEYAREADEAKMLFPNLSVDTSSNAETRKMELIQDGKIVKWTAHSTTETDVDGKKEVYSYRNKISYMFRYLGITHIVTPNSLIESGIIDRINSLAKELNRSVEEIIYDKKYYDAICYQFNKKIVRSTFLKKYEKFLVG